MIHRKTTCAPRNRQLVIRNRTLLVEPHQRQVSSHPFSPVIITDTLDAALPTP